MINRTQKDKLIIALQIDAIVGDINRVLRTRKASLQLDYSIDYSPRLFLDRPGVEREAIMVYDPRKKACYVVPPKNFELLVIFTDLVTQMQKHEASLRLVGNKPINKRRRCVLQVYVSGARTIALTLMEAFRGDCVKDTDFQLPDGSTP